MSHTLKLAVNYDLIIIISSSRLHDEDEQRQRYIPTPSQFCQDDGSYLISCSCSSSLVDVKSLDNELGRIS
ncbi:unnamed protein product [Rotaria sp. Silwood1]|nr:unnamed protein product [Rotaria sp. Silwood1]CAF1456274.1 unnamed protein product [Rotaria sp. Silwood1]CAF1458068.1 unnamed protein product [Rotaria sp. Silwood1]CAF3627950.1 unnamed protein product [Rotaria sp. Silwood1]CAF5053643.1 unnamed protein product [Rotaria sp. Silwood1]